MNETGDTPLLSGVSGHVDTSNEPQWEAQGDTASLPGSPILPHHHVVKTDPVLLPTAGELREHGYEVDPELADEQEVRVYSGDSAGGQVAEEVPGTGDSPSEAGSPPRFAEETPYQEPLPPGQTDSELVAAGEDASTSREFREGKIAGPDAKNPYDRRTRQGKDWDAGHGTTSS